MREKFQCVAGSLWMARKAWQIVGLWLSRVSLFMKHRNDKLDVSYICVTRTQQLLTLASHRLLKILHFQPFH